MTLPEVPFDSKPLNGLRGLGALHILLFHVFSKGDPGISLFGWARSTIRSEKFPIGVQPGTQFNWILKTLLNILLRFLFSFTGCPTVLQNSIDKSIEYYSIEFSIFN